MTHHQTTQQDRGWARRYAAFEDLVSGVCLVVGITLIFYGVLMRYVFARPLYWVDEISTYLAVWGAILGWSVAERDGRHIRVTLLFDRVPARAKRWMALVASGASAAFCLLLAYMGYILEIRYFSSGQVTLNTQVPLWVVYGSVPLAAVMLAGRYVVEFITLLGGNLVDGGSAVALTTTPRHLLRRESGQMKQPSDGSP